MDWQDGWRRVCIYRGRVIITDGRVFMRFWSNARYRSLRAVKAAIDAEQ